MSDDLFKKLTYHPSRIPALDALSAFVPDNVEEDPAVQAAASRVGCNPWYPENGGHRVLILYEGGPYEANRFTIEKGGWDHEHCKRCGETIEPMTLCWVSAGDQYVILCESCHKLLLAMDRPENALDLPRRKFAVIDSMDISLECASPFAETRGTESAEKCSAKWQDCCLDFFDEFFGSYEIQGGRIPRNTHDARLFPLVRHATR